MFQIFKGFKYFMFLIRDLNISKILFRYQNVGLL